MMLSKHIQAGRYSKKSLKKTNEPEEELQRDVNEYLAFRQIDYIRIPNTSSVAAIRGALCGRPDNTCKIPISDKYSLCLELELKTKSGLHGEQIRLSRDNPWQIAQTFEDARAIIDAFVKDAELIKEMIRKYGGK